MNTVFTYVIGHGLLNNKNFRVIRPAVLEKMTFKVAIFSHFPAITELKLPLPPDVMG